MGARLDERMKAYGKFTQCQFGCCADVPPSRFRGTRPMTQDDRIVRKHVKTSERMRVRVMLRESIGDALREIGGL
jgi:hypothetical protein